MAQRQRILVANSSKFLGNSVWSRLIPEPEFEIVGLACDTEEAVDLSTSLSPDVVLVDMSRAELCGLHTIQSLHKVHPEIPVIAFMPTSPGECTQVVLDAGAAACLTKSEIADMLLQTLRNLIPVRSLVTSRLLNYS